MVDLTFEELVTAARKLPRSKKAALVQALRESPGGSLTREDVIAELEALRTSGAFNDVESLYGKYPHSGVEPSEDELHTTLHEAATQWEDELDEFFSDAN
jgi:hypothetical protein